MNKMVLLGVASLLFIPSLLGRGLNFKSVINHSTDLCHFKLSNGRTERMVIIEPSSTTRLDDVTLSYGDSIDIHQFKTIPTSGSTASLTSESSQSSVSSSSSSSSANQDESFKQIVWSESDMLSIYRVDGTGRRKLLDGFRFEGFPAYDFEITSKGRILLNINEEYLAWQNHLHNLNDRLASMAARRVLLLAFRQKYEKRYHRTFRSPQKAIYYHQRRQRRKKKRKLQYEQLKKLHEEKNSTQKT